jgi:hypothetical protein
MADAACAVVNCAMISAAAVTEQIIGRKQLAVLA